LFAKQEPFGDGNAILEMLFVILPKRENKEHTNAKKFNIVSKLLVYSFHRTLNVFKCVVAMVSTLDFLLEGIH